MADNLVCPACRHATRKHGPDGCDAVVGCWCDMAPAAINAPEVATPEPAPAIAEPTPPARCPDGHGPNMVCGYCRPEPEPLVDEPAAAELPLVPPKRSAPSSTPRPPVARPRRPRPAKAPAPVARPYIGQALNQAAPAIRARIEAAVDRVAPQVLGRWESFLCEPCGGRFFAPGSHCGDPLTPVWVTLTRREVSDGRA